MAAPVLLPRPSAKGKLDFLVNPMIGRTISHYQILEKLGAGGMGEVYKAQDTSLDRLVAVKVLPGDRLADPQLRARFEREARAISSLSHPNICTLYDFMEQEGSAFLIMEYLEGKPLKGPMPLEEALRLAVQIADALDHAHQRGVIHRDLKPGNIVVVKSGAKLVDFGLAKLARAQKPEEEATRTAGLTQEGTILGTFHYMAPEQWEAKEADARSDIFSFGAVLHEMITGKRAFEGKSQASLIAAIMERTPPPVSSLQPMSPPGLDHVVKKCLEKDPDRRWQSAADLKDELQWVSESAGRGEETTPSGLVRRPGVRPRVTIGLAAALILALAAIVALWLGRSSSSPDSTSRQVSRLVVKVSEGSIPAGTRSPLALSPDGSKLVYVARRGGTWSLYLRRLDQFQASPIPGTEGGSCPFFSTDGNWVGFFAGGKLKKVSLTGDTPLTLCETKSGTLVGGSWAPDGTIVFAPGSPFGLMRVSANGGAPVVFTTPDPKQGEVAHIWPDVLPDGKGVLFTVYRAGFGFGEHPIAVLPSNGGERQVLSRDFTFARYAATGDLICYREGSVVALPFDPKHLKVTGPPVSLLEGVGRGALHAPLLSLSGSDSLVYVTDDARTRASRLVWVDPAGNVQPLRAPEQESGFLALSPDGRLLAMTITNQQGSHIWIWDSQREALNRLTYEGNNHAPIWSPDGQWVVFSSDQEGPEANLWRKRADGTGRAERLLKSVNHQDPGSFSPDGKLLAFGEFGGGSRLDIWVLAMDGERVARPFLQTQFNESEQMISPDGRWLAYSSDESGRSEVYVQPFPQGGRKWQVSSKGANQPLWAPDGRHLFFRTQDSVMDLAIETQPEFRLGRQRVLFSGDFMGRSGFGHPNYDISRDGQRFLMLQPVLPEGEGATEINVILNWSEELKRLAPSRNRAGK